MEVWYLAAWIAGFIIFVGLMFWLVNDIWEDWGFSGCFIAGMVIITTIPIFPLLLPTYIYLKHNYFAKRRPAKGSAQFPADHWAWRSQRLREEQEKKRLPYISAAESDERVDLLLAEGKREAALAAAQEFLETAQGFADDRGILRYSKYVEYIKRGGEGR